ncbi:hypothetical protein M408DRAFT_240557 [Serendipita vermifera MAFF 305830]|uniref:Uncharacterized protein n=1 Tax=Serendipita vermifera MAFF 305830 TaxID=933852 RepID=A0A0C2X0U1_SERVB|nr:hypothetical protein M408DRAFT_240557 [Serendipita vermifera MAFF 305830]
MPGRDEDVRVCLQALSEMRWAFSKGNERSQSIRLAWRSQSDYQGPAVQASPKTQNGDDRNPANGTPRSLPSNPSSPHKRAHATPPTNNTYTGSVQQHQLHVASLPSHTAPRLPATASTSSQPALPPRESPLAQQQRHMPPQDVHSQMQPHLARQDFNATPIPSVDRGIDQYTTQPHWSPVRNQPPLGPTSVHSSSSDGSSPPEITSHPIPHYNNMPMKSPTTYEAPSGVYRHTPTETPMFSHSHPRTNGNIPNYPPATGQARHMGAGLEPISSAQQYPQQYPVTYHPGANQYPPAAASNGMNMNHFIFPARQHPHTATYPTAALSPDEIGGYTNGSEYFALPPAAGYHNVIPGRPLGHETTYVPYPDNGLYYAPQ